MSSAFIADRTCKICVVFDNDLCDPYKTTLQIVILQRLAQGYFMLSEINISMTLYLLM